MRYLIWEGNIEKLRKKVKTIMNKAKKYGCNFHYEEIGEKYEEIENPNKEKQIFRFIEVEVSGEVKINGWKLIAINKRFSDEENFLTKIDFTEEIPVRYRTTDMCLCEHCNTNRNRKNTCIIKNIKTGEFKQVGNSCLKDFTQGMDDKSVGYYESMINLLEEEKFGRDFFSFRQVPYYPVKELLYIANGVVKHLGYAKTRHEDGELNYDSTKGKVMLFYKLIQNDYRYKEQYKEDYKIIDKINFFSEENKEEIEAILVWLKNLDNNSDYFYSLKLLAGEKYVTEDKVGILVSLIPTYNREMQKENKKENEKEKSEYVGQIGEKVTCKVLSFETVTSWETSYDGYNLSTTYLYKFVTEKGNVIMWKTSKFIEGECNTITGKIKELKEFNGVKQTFLTRCKIA